MMAPRFCLYCYNDYTEPKCPTCALLALEPRPVKSPFIVCQCCRFENDVKNQVCVSCDEKLRGGSRPQRKMCEICGQQVVHAYEEHVMNCELSMREVLAMEDEVPAVVSEEDIYKLLVLKCKYCGLEVHEDLIRDHNYLCEKKPRVDSAATLKQCKFCLTKFDAAIINEHVAICSLKPVIDCRKPIVLHKPELKPRPQIPIGLPAADLIVSPAKMGKETKETLFIESELQRMSKLQIQAMVYMHNKSSELHQKARKQLETRVKNLKYTMEDLENLLFYIEHLAPIIVHIHITKHMEFFVKDTHYRNQFETGKSSGSLSRQSRTTWEDRMFDKKYSAATDPERVKYGVINFTNDPKGVKCASSYGISYFLLKEHVRNRCTLTDMDSSSTTSVIGTFKFCFHVLSKMNDKELLSAFQAAKALEEASSVSSTYKQIQIHGPIEFAKDIQRVYVNKKEVQDKKLLDMVYEFCDKNKIDYQFMDC